MTIWVDAQLSPIIAAWINQSFPQISAVSVRALGLRDASDYEIYSKAKEAGATIISKDSDFQQLISQYGTPPKFIWVTCGNTSNQKMRDILDLTLQKALDLLNDGEEMVEISDR